jgi:thiol-disulfide isomerase/thioredoxin
MTVPKWMGAVLVLAGVYNLAWGGWVVMYPAALFQWQGLEEPNYLTIWQCVGMIVGVYGVGYLIAASDPMRHWPIVLVGLLGKVFGPIGFLLAYGQGELPAAFAWLCLTNDVIWWVPFGMILYGAFRWNSEIGRSIPVPPMQDLLRQSCSHRGHSLAELSRSKPTMVVFLRHSGCTFCRMVMADLGEVRRELDRLPIHVVVVHMGSPLDGTLLLSKYDVDYWHHISDPFCVLYRGFGLKRGTFGQLFSWKVLFKGIYHGLVGGHGIGPLRGDGFFLPGVYMLSQGEVLLRRPAEDASQRPDFVAIANEGLAMAEGRSDRLRSEAPATCRVEPA